MNLAERYGPWALIAGASEGTGRAFARALAAEGVNCLLLARREGPLAALRDELVREFGVEAEIMCVDLALPDLAAESPPGRTASPSAS